MRTVIKTDLISICKKWGINFTSHFYLRLNALRNYPAISRKEIDRFIRKFTTGYFDGILSVNGEQYWKVVEGKSDISALVKVENGSALLISVKRNDNKEKIYRTVNNTIYI